MLELLERSDVLTSFLDTKPTLTRTEQQHKADLPPCHNNGKVVDETDLTRTVSTVAVKPLTREKAIL